MPPVDYNLARMNVWSRDGLHYPFPDFSTRNQPIAFFCINYSHHPEI